MTEADRKTQEEWDGYRNPYRPAEPLAIDPSVRMHADAEQEIDPVTFELVNTKLWNINEEHAETIKRVSGSPVVVHANDFNTCIMTETGEAFLFAPYIQYFTSSSEFIIKYTLETRSQSPGIAPGDVFIHNDIYIAGSHQQDVGVYAPVFVEGRLFCWVFSACHVRDIGGVEPGSFCAQAPNVYYDPPFVRAMKLVDGEHGFLRDAEDTILRMSRVPDLLALELRSQVAGAQRATARILALVERYGAPVVKAVMHKLIDDTESAVRARLARVPDGRWVDQVWMSGALPGDKQPYRQLLSLEKDGDRLVFDNRGTDPQIGCINCGYGQYRSAIGTALAQMLAFDHRYCVGGINRIVECEAEVGTITAVDRDGAVSALHAQLLTIYMAGKLLSRMLYPDPELRERVIATSGLATSAWLTQSGIDQFGDPFATVTLDQGAGGIGAFSFRDGVDQGGSAFWPKLEIGDCETLEQVVPVIYLYRRGAVNCGHGRFRGGNGLAYGWVGHRTEDQLVSAISVASSLSIQSGLFGGHWGESGLFRAGQQTNIRAEMAAGRLPTEPAELRGGGEVEVLPPKTMAIPLGESDVVEVSVFGAGGYGDPLRRDPEAVAADARSQLITEHAIREVYGVVLEGGEVDGAATEALRGSIRESRLRGAAAPRRAAPEFDEVEGNELELTDSLVLARLRDGSRAVACDCCGTVVAPADANYKDYCPTLTGELHEVEPSVFPEASQELEVEVAYRTFLCPGCGVAIDNELNLASEPPVWDMRLDLDRLEVGARTPDEADQPLVANLEGAK